VQARAELVNLARVCALGNWAFTEWLHGRTLALRGMPGQSWNAAAFLIAEYAVSADAGLFAGQAPLPRRIKAPRHRAAVI